MKIPDKTLNFIAAQEAHFSIAFSVGLAASFFHADLFALAGLLVIAVLKEAFVDPVNENNQPFLWAGMTDFAFYVLGTLAAVAFLHFA